MMTAVYSARVDDLNCSEPRTLPLRPGQALWNRYSTGGAAHSWGRLPQLDPTYDAPEEGARSRLDGGWEQREAGHTSPAHHLL